MTHTAEIIPFPARAAVRERRFPSGWWIVPAALIGSAMWAVGFWCLWFMVKGLA
jgi:hypothetical protein